MGQKLKLTKNKAGRMVPSMVNGVKYVPFKGVGKYLPNGVKATSSISSCQNYPESGNKVVSSLKEALEKCTEEGSTVVCEDAIFTRKKPPCLNEIMEKNKANKIEVLNQDPIRNLEEHLIWVKILLSYQISWKKRKIHLLYIIFWKK